MMNYNLCLAWNWEYDVDFAILLKDACTLQGLSLLQATPDNLGGLIQSLNNQEIFFQALFDRATDVDASFMPLVQWTCDHGVFCINSFEQASSTWDKAAMHQTLVNAGLHTPDTIVLPSCEEQPALLPIDLRSLGEPFIIKPAHGSGGNGVVKEACTLDHVIAVRQEYPTDKYLLQAHIIPRELDSRPAWFRVIYCAGQVYPCWWHPNTHIYAPVTINEENVYGLSPLRDTMVSIANLIGLDLFSTEIAFTNDGHFMVIDYVNDQLDLRLQSKASDGVPDEVVQDIAKRLVSLVAAQGKPPPDYEVSQATMKNIA
jgi:hypothetical protein